MESHSAKMIGIPVPVDTDLVSAPVVTYGGGPASIKFLTEDERWARVTFEKLDSIRVSRGEYDPYPRDRKPGHPFYWVSEVVPSAWLHERYEYEKSHYGQSYEWTGDVDEMLRDFSHYVFTFHDQFVEVLATGIWFETVDDEIDTEEASATHPLRNLPRPAEPQLLKAHGLACEIWPNTLPIDQLLEDAKLCSQKLLQFAPVLDGSARVSLTLSVRVRRGKAKSRLSPSIGRDLATFDGVAGLEDARPYVEKRLKEVKENRKRLGKG